ARPAAAAASTFNQYTYSGSAGSRTYYVYTPVNYTTGQRVPLIVMLHGCGGNAVDFSNTTQMNALADSKQFIVVYPQQSSTYNGGPDPILQGAAAYSAMGSHARVVPVIAFQGTQDTTVPPINGDQVVRQWMETDRLASGGTYNGSFSAPSGTVAGQVPGGRAY